MTAGRAGKWAGLSSPLISELMGCSQSHAKRILSSLKEDLGRELVREDIGILIHDFRQAKSEKNLSNWLHRWRGPAPI